MFVILCFFTVLFTGWLRFRRLHVGGGDQAASRPAVPLNDFGNIKDIWIPFAFEH